MPANRQTGATIPTHLDMCSSHFVPCMLWLQGIKMAFQSDWKLPALFAVSRPPAAFPFESKHAARALPGVSVGTNPTFCGALCDESGRAHLERAFFLFASFELDDGLLACLQVFQL